MQAWAKAYNLIKQRVLPCSKTLVVKQYRLDYKGCGLPM
ncbi:hypothetical protein AEST_15400 [Alishewanella aestuarii B11]|uniref:Uncharacterized protein n=1 Tax=Alishewanella aestuarii B11 TaxID=1197174 RepID=J2IFT9_9ALTE|nr:hypothetical protein AEST_15400 [Alishewanella aestuarii B11]